MAVTDSSFISPHTASQPTENMFATNKVDQDFKRAADHQHKWRLGNRFADDPERPPRPGRQAGLLVYHRHPPRSHLMPSVRDVDDVFTSGMGHFREAVFDDPLEASGSMYEHGTLEGEPDAGVTYSFDLPGPADGTCVFAQALGLAVERYEDRKTKTLVKDEYDVISSAGDGDEHLATRSVEDDFELLESPEV